MAELKTLAMDVAASLWLQAASFDDLYLRKIESLKNMSEWSFNCILVMAKEKDWIYMKGNKYFCRKKEAIPRVKKI